MAAIVDVGIEPEDLPSRRQAVQQWVESARRVPEIYYSIGVHPGSVDAGYAEKMQLLESCAERERGASDIVAVGEIGLDFYRDAGFAAEQHAVFAMQLELARSASLPVIIHNRNAQKEVLSHFRQSRPEGVMHCFSQDAAYARSCLDLGLYISFAGNLTFTSAASIQEAARIVPNDRILVETDSPYLSPQPVRGRPNHPGHLGFTIAFLAEIRGQDVDELTRHTAENARRLFGIN